MLTMRGTPNPYYTNFYPTYMNNGCGLMGIAANDYNVIMGSAPIDKLSNLVLAVITMKKQTANMPKEMAEYLNKMGAGIPNIKPGKATVEYLGKIQASTRFWGISLSTIFSAAISVIRHVCDD
ncbi:Preprotein translocase subunit SCY2, chloroplastic [Artemisia annua]|uniref:Preprotein translocase subunit SCY2, chloroplastic n=1 Tax=Artemisia annua TaxID=35608 RepID=A0A2U1PKP6_ARTAN|nr:Preprotein translocase subunit SCY2, chloroplastic [Artemisia annua]